MENRSVVHRKKTFHAVLGNTLVAGVTNSFVWFVLTFWLFLQTRSILATSLLAGIFAVLSVLTSIFFGAIVDHHKKKIVMLCSSIGSLCAYSIGLILYIFFFSDGVLVIGDVMLWILITVLMIGSIIGNLRMIALTTVVTLLIDEKDRDKANGMVGTVNGISFAITSVFSGLVIGFFGMGVALIIAVICTLLALLHIAFVHIPEQKVISDSTVREKIDLTGTWRITKTIPGFLMLVFFSTFNNFLGGIFMALMDAYGLSLVSVQAWGALWGCLSVLFIVGGFLVSRFGLGASPLRTLLFLNLVVWASCIFFTLQPWVWLFVLGAATWMITTPAIEAAEQTIIQKVIPFHRQGRVVGFAQSIESAAAPVTAFLIGPLTHFFFVPFMTTGFGAATIGSWFGTGQDRAIALVFTLAGIIGVVVTFFVQRSKSAKRLSDAYEAGAHLPE